MGIPFFLYVLSKRYPRILLNRCPKYVSSLNFDLNSLIHRCAQITWSYGDYKNEARSRYVAKTSFEVLEREFYQLLVSEIMQIITEVQPREVLTLAVDGVAPMAKIQQQRQRRYRTAKEREDDAKAEALKREEEKKREEKRKKEEKRKEERRKRLEEKKKEKEKTEEIPTPTEEKSETKSDGVQTEKTEEEKKEGEEEEISEISPFDSAAITPGTDFMRRLDAFLRDWLGSHRDFKLPQANVFLLPPKIIYSSHLVPGEGEHKILDLMRSGEISGEGAHILYGLDADLVMLSLVAPVDRIYLLRKDVDNIISIDILKEYLYKDLPLPKGVPLRTALHDFVFMMYLVGNDFLPATPSFYDMTLAIETMMNVYRSLKQPLTNGESLNGPAIADFIERLSKQEVQLLTQLSGKETKYPSRMFEFATITISSTPNPLNPMETYFYLRSTTKRFDFDRFRGIWYQNTLGPKYVPPNLVSYNPYHVTIERVRQMVKSYLTGLAWTYSYYIQGLGSVSSYYYYEYHYAPLLVDLAAIARTWKFELPSRPEDELEVNPVHQLLAVLPPQSHNLLPEEVSILVGSYSPIIDLFPRSFEIELDGRNYRHQGVAIIPMADINRIIDAVNRLTQWDPERASLFSTDFNLIITRTSEQISLTQDQEDNLFVRRQQQMCSRRPACPRNRQFRSAVSVPPLPPSFHHPERDPLPRPESDQARFYYRSGVRPQGQPSWPGMVSYNQGVVPGERAPTQEVHAVPPYPRNQQRATQWKPPPRPVNEQSRQEAWRSKKLLI